jgi:transposase
MPLPIHSFRLRLAPRHIHGEAGHEPTQIPVDGRCLAAHAAELDAALGKALAPIRERARLWTTMLVISNRTASVVLAEIGVDMPRFLTTGHLLSWAGLGLRRDESAGKRRPTWVRKSGTWSKTTLVTAAWTAVRVKTNCLHPEFLRIKARRGAKKAILAMAAPMLTAAFHILRDGTEYNDLGYDVSDLGSSDNDVPSSSLGYEASCSWRGLV